MPEEDTRQCSGCGSPVPISENECSYCGLNLDTGESFEVRVKKAKQDMDHEAAPLNTVLMLPVIAFALAVFAGYMYQRQAESALQENKSVAQEYLKRLKKVDILVQFGDVSEARKLCKKVVEDIKNEATKKKETSSDEEEGGSGRKSVLLSIQAKAEHKLQKLSK